jgi:hypothetical protein
MIGHDEPEDKPPSTTQKGLRNLVEQTQRRKEELKLAFNLNWTLTEPEVIAKVVDECWQLEETGRDLWNQCEKLRVMILDNRMLVFSCEDRQRMVDNIKQLTARVYWQTDPGRHIIVGSRRSPRPNVLSRPRMVIVTSATSGIPVRIMKMFLRLPEKIRRG